METSIANNPLAKHFRQPAIYLKLPSKGKFYPEGTLELGVSGDIPVYPMTVKDEFVLKTPDALMNGTSMSEMIRSCCPSIKDPWAIPMIDLDPILIAIRLASYGHDMDMKSNCQHCQAENDHTVDLRQVLDQLKPATAFDQTTYLDGLVFDVQPQTFQDINTASQMAFEQQRIIAVVSDTTTDIDERKAKFNESFAKLTELNIGTLVSCIKSITTAEGVKVIEKELIRDFLNNCDRKTYDDVREMITEKLKSTALDPMTVPCESCEKQYKITLDFNQSNFFA